MATQPARYRKSPKTAGSDAVPAQSKEPTPKPTAQPGFSVVDVVRMVLGILLLSSVLSYFITGDSVLWGWRPWFVRPEVLKQKMSGALSLTDAELLKYDGTDTTLPIYIALNGSIYDVSAAPKTYGPGGSYHFFAGKDAARAFLTGCFQEDQTPDLRGVEDMYIPIDDPADDAKLSKGQLKIRRERDMRQAKKKVKETIDHWAEMFRGDSGRPYFWVGTVKRDPDWLEKSVQPVLCAQAEQGRQTRKDAEAIEKAEAAQRHSQ